jgi:hypothetical protein
MSLANVGVGTPCPLDRVRDLGPDRPKSGLPDFGHLFDNQVEQARPGAAGTTPVSAALASVVTLTLVSHLSRARRSTSWWCAADPGPFQTPESGTVPD